MCKHFFCFCEIESDCIYFTRSYICKNGITWHIFINNLLLNFIRPELIQDEH